MPRPMRREDRGRVLALAAAIVAAAVTIGASACAHAGATGEGGESAYQANVALRPDSTLRIARTQLEHHNFKVSAAGANAIVTFPAPIPAHLQDASTKGRYWMLRVAADPRAIGGGSRLTVTGYVLPPASSSAGGAAPPPKEAVVVTSANRALFGEVQAAGRWIQDEAFRNRKRGR